MRTNDKKQELEQAWKQYLLNGNDLKARAEFELKLAHDLQENGMLKAYRILRSKKEAKKLVNEMLGEFFARLKNNKKNKQQALQQSWTTALKQFKLEVEKKSKARVASFWERYAVSLDRNIKNILTKILLHHFYYLINNSYRNLEKEEKINVVNDKISNFFSEFEQGKRKKKNFKRITNIQAFLYPTIMNGFAEIFRKKYYRELPIEVALHIVEENDFENNKARQKKLDFIEEKLTLGVRSLFQIMRRETDKNIIAEELNITKTQLYSRTQTMKNQCVEIALKYKANLESFSYGT